MRKTFKIPAGKYKSCLLMECEQLTNRDKNKNQVYHLFFSSKLGYVDDLKQKQMSSYLKEV